MKSKLLLLGVLFMPTSIYSQNSVTFYKDAKCSIVTTELKAKYELTETILNDSTITKKLVSLKNKQTIWMKEYNDGIPSGDWKFYKNSGVLDYVIPYGAIIPDGYFMMNRDFMIDNRNNHSYELPTINNGESYLEYIAMNVNYPLEVKENGITGTVYLQITISKEGKAENRRIVFGIHELVDKEAILLLNKMTVWNPSKVNGKPIDTYLIIPITFSIN